MPTLTSCPSCAKQLKVPDELIGRQVKCPACGTTFTAAAESAPPPMPAPIAPSPEYAPRRDEYGQYDQGVERPRRSGPNPLSGPGIALLISAILNLLTSGYLAVNGIVTVSNPEFATQNAEMGMKWMSGGKDLTPEQKQQAQDQIKVQGPAMAGVGVLGLICSILTLLGAIGMMKGRKSGLGWTAAILSVIPCTSPCCCAGIPIGIWAMIALNKAS